MTGGYIKYVDVMKRFHNLHSLIYGYNRYILKAENCMFETKKDEWYNRDRHEFVLMYQYDYYMSNTSLEDMENFINSFNLV